MQFNHTHAVHGALDWCEYSKKKKKKSEPIEVSVNAREQYLYNTYLIKSNQIRAQTRIQLYNKALVSDAHKQTNK